jgi:hypothetical protein
MIKSRREEKKPINLLNLRKIMLCFGHCLLTFNSRYAKMNLIARRKTGRCVYEAR